MNGSGMFPTPTVTLLAGLGDLDRQFVLRSVDKIVREVEQVFAVHLHLDSGLATLDDRHQVFHNGQNIRLNVTLPPADKKQSHRPGMERWRKYNNVIYMNINKLMFDKSGVEKLRINRISRGRTNFNRRETFSIR